MNKIKAGIVGGAGYTGGELTRLLLLHHFVEISFVQSASHTGKPLCDVHTDLTGETDLLFSGQHSYDADVLFLCGGHDAARKFLLENDLPAEMVVIDLSHDFRHQQTNVTGNRTFVYGLPELNRAKIAKANSIANPGCFATCIELALLPLADAKKLSDEIHVNATTGSTGAGQSLSHTTHFSWRESNVTVYKAFEHQHLKEISEALTIAQSDFKSGINFIPQRGNFTRGIFASVYTQCNVTLDELKAMYALYYAAHPFVTICEKEVDVKQVVNTNRCFIHLQKHKEFILVTSVIDNLLKGASGQAVQNMNIIFGFDERAGLQLKPSAF